MFSKKSFVTFLVAGHPNLEESEAMASAMIEEGAACLEIGLPFSDPLADGPVIQMAAAEALANGAGIQNVLSMVSRLRKRHPTIPMVLFTYLNPLLKFGLADYVKAAKQAGVTATLTVDLPPEEAEDYCLLHEQEGLGTVFLASPTTSEERLRKIDSLSTAFVYYVSRTGVTGERAELSSSLEQEVARVRKHVKKPLAIGFGIASAEQAKAVSKLADAVVVGSAIVRMIAEKKGEAEVRDFIRSCVQAIARGGSRG